MSEICNQSPKMILKFIWKSRWNFPYEADTEREYWGENFYLQILGMCSGVQRAQRAHTNPRRDRELKRTKLSLKWCVCVCVCVKLNISNRKC